jgi:hypothetical protein
LVLLLAISLVVVGYPAPAPESQPREKVIDILTCPLGTACYSMGMSVSETLKKYHPWLRARVAETPGYIYNFAYLERSPDLWTTTSLSPLFNKKYLTLCNLRYFESGFVLPMRSPHRHLIQTAQRAFLAQ